MNKTAIEWTDFSANPLKYRDSEGNVVWACVHSSIGCQKCYSEALAKRYGRGGKFDVSTMEGLTPFLDEKELHSMRTYKPASGKRCFIGDMTDLFGDWVPFDLLDKLFAVMTIRKDVTWQVLTKRAARMLEYFDDIGYRQEMIGIEAEMISGKDRFLHGSEAQAITGCADDILPRWTLPLPNVWLGVSVENQKYADERIPSLLKTPAVKRFVSYEPALGPVDFKKIHEQIQPADSEFQLVGGNHQEWNALNGQIIHGRLGYNGNRLNWVIAGSESGVGARPAELDWFTKVRDDCQSAGTAYFLKQFAINGRKQPLPELDGRQWMEFPK